MKIFAMLLICGLWVGCGNSNDIEIIAPEIVSGNLEVISLKDKHVISSAKVSNIRTRFGASELGLGVEPVVIKITNEAGGVFSAAVGVDNQMDYINVNALTTLAACRQSWENGDFEKQNHLLSKQLTISDLNRVIPDLEFSNISDFNDAIAYGILLGAFEMLAKNIHMTSSQLMALLCDDVSFDGQFNGTGKDGIIQNDHPFYDEQVLKLQYAKAIDDFAQKKPSIFSTLPIQAFANEISLSHVEGLFSPTIENYSFDQ